LSARWLERFEPFPRRGHAAVTPPTAQAALCRSLGRIFDQPTDFFTGPLGATARLADDG
jgi:hypothetical protein